MTVTLKSSATGSPSVVPALAIGMATQIETNSVVHVLASGRRVVFYLGASARSGTLIFLFTDEAAAWAALALHKLAAPITLTDTDRPRHGMTYAVQDQIALELDPETLENWILTVPYQEVV